MRYGLVFAFLLFIGSLYSQGGILTDYYDWEFSYDDATSWSEEFPMENGIFWMRAPIMIPELLDSFEAYAVCISMLASYEVFWDGELIGKNGKVGNSKQSEVPGQINTAYVVPQRDLKPGKHEVKVRFSNHHAGNNMRYYGIALLDYDDAIIQPLIKTAYIHIYAGFFLIVGLFYLFRFFINSRENAVLLFSMLCLGFFALIIIEYLRNYYNYPYPFHFVRLQIILGITIFLSYCMTLFFLARFKFKWNYYVLAAQTLIIVILVTIRNQGYDYTTNFTMILGFLISSLITIFAIRKGKNDAWLLLASVLPLPLVLSFDLFRYDTLLYVAFGNLVLVNLVSLARQEKSVLDEKIKAERLSERLKLDLLRKNIQPHFINNSLTSAIDWIERSPEKGVEFLFALSKEFDILLEISDMKLIPVVKEIELCKAHLDIMTFRKEEPYTLVTENIDEYELIPPAIFLTIIENGITHQSAGGNGLVFYLSYRKENGRKVYRIYVDGDMELSKTVEKGTGTKYIEARLIESYHENWEYKSQPKDKGWESIIVLIP